MSRVLIVDDEPSICWSLSEALQDEGYQTETASSAEEALTRVESFPPHVILLDVRLPGISGLEAIESFRQRAPQASLVIMTAFGDLSTAVTAIQRQAFDYLTKPFELDQALEVVRRAVRSQESPPAAAELPTQNADGILGSSPLMQSVFKQIALAAQTDVPVLITGESGTGKELVAQAIHRHSPRGQHPLIPVSLAAMNENLVESELFGHVRGAFTGADRDRRGVLELADRGSVFLDEIGDVSPAMQVKLLRAVERHEWLPVGDATPRTGDFRIIAATHRPLVEMIESGEFREDLYFRLAVFHIELPPLRDRVEDIEVMATAFLSELRDSLGEKRLSPQALQELQSRRWSGNVRELKNTVQRAAILARGFEIEAEHLPPAVLGQAAGDAGWAGKIEQSVESWVNERLEQDPEASAIHEQLLELVEPPLLQTVLRKFGGNRVAASQRLGIHRTTLRQKLRRYGLDSRDDTSE